MINVCLTANRYYLGMLKRNQKQQPIKTAKSTGIWLALAVALGMHAIFLSLPISRQIPINKTDRALIELQLTTVDRHAPDVETRMQKPQTPPEPEAEIAAEPSKRPVEPLAEVATVEPAPAMLIPIPQAADLKNVLEDAYEPDERQLTNSILVRQFITEISVTDRLFPDILSQPNSGFQAEYHYPVRQSMIAMLDQPMQDLPFAYEPGLVHFAYDPGVKGDLQRFWDVITPEFGWRTKYGTEVKCIWILVIGACAWK